MKKDVNGFIIDMTEEEIEIMMDKDIEVMPTEEERINALENALIELVGVVIDG